MIVLDVIETAFSIAADRGINTLADRVNIKKRKTKIIKSITQFLESQKEHPFFNTLDRTLGNSRLLQDYINSFDTP